MTPSVPAVVVPDGLPGSVTEVSLRLRRGLTIEQWADSLRLLGRMSHGVQWWIGDAINYGAETYGEKAAQFVHELGYEEQTLLNLAWVSHAVPMASRRPELSWSHHAEVAKLETAEQKAWLTKAVKGDAAGVWSCRKLRSEIRGVKAKEPEREVCPACGGTGYKA